MNINGEYKLKYMRLGDKMMTGEKTRDSHVPHMTATIKPLAMEECIPFTHKSTYGNTNRKA